METVLYEKAGKIAYITLNRPERLNAINTTMQRELPSIWKDFGLDPKVRVAVLTGAGNKAFCSGVDVKEVASGHQAMPTQGRHRLTAKSNGVYKPVILAVNGLCCGGGLGFVADSDICICADNATFFDTHARIGIVEATAAIRLARRVPLESVMRLVLLGRAEPLPARRACELGLVGEVVPANRLMSRAYELAQHILENAPHAMEVSIETIWSSLNYGLQDALDYGFQRIKENFYNDEFQEGTRAFAEKRPPSWTV